MPKHLFLDAIKLCYGINSNTNVVDKNDHRNNNSSITMALASGLPQYFAMLYCQLSDNNQDNNNKTVSGDVMTALMQVLSLKQPTNVDQFYTYPQFCSSILDQFNRTHLNKPKSEMRLPTMDNHLDDLVRSSDWQWRSLETVNERFLVKKLTDSTTSSTTMKSVEQIYDIEIENLLRQIVHKKAENDVLKNVCRDLCSHIRRMDSACLSLQVKLYRSTNSSNSTKISTAIVNECSEPTLSRQNSSTKKLRKLNSRLVKQMHTISNKMTTLKRTLSDATPLVRRLEELFVTKVANSSNQCDEKQNGNNVSVADSGWMSDDDMQFSEAMTTSGASDNLFAQTAPFDKDEIKEEPLAEPKTTVPATDDVSENSSRRSEKMLQNSSPFTISSKKSVQEITDDDDDIDVEYSCEEILFEDDVVGDGDDDGIEEDTTTRELKAKLFMISQRLNEAETKLHRVLQNTK